MGINKIFDDTKKKMDNAKDILKQELAKFRTGRASVGMLEGIKADYYGTLTPINQLSTITVPESRLIIIQPWDIGQIQAIEKAIFASSTGLTPANDGKVIRIQVPPLTEERRKELTKVARRYGEECKVAIRNCRRDANEEIKKMEKDKLTSQDESKKALLRVQEITDLEIKGVDDLLAKKEREMMEV